MLLQTLGNAYEYCLTVPQHSRKRTEQERRDEGLLMPLPTSVDSNALKVLRVKTKYKPLSRKLELL